MKNFFHQFYLEEFVWFLETFTISVEAGIRILFHNDIVTTLRLKYAQKNNLKSFGADTRDKSYLSTKKNITN